MTRSRCRSWLFGYFAGTLSGPERNRVESALRLLTVEEFEVLYAAHQSRAADVDWPSEAAAVAKLGEALSLVGVA